MVLTDACDMAYRVVCALLLLCPSISADSINKLFSAIVPSGRTAHSNRRSEGVNAVSKFIHRNYGRCGAVKILLPQWTTAPAYDFLLQVAVALNESPDSDAHTGSSFPAIKSVSFFHMRNTSSFVGGFLDGFVAWTTPCVVNIVPFTIDVPGQELGTGVEWSAIENAFDFLYKLSSRDHSCNLLLLAVTGGTGTLFGSGTEGTLLESKPLFNRLSKKLRNYRFACVVADDSVAAVVRFEDSGNAASFKLQRIAVRKPLCYKDNAFSCERVPGNKLMVFANLNFSFSRKV